MTNKDFLSQFSGDNKKPDSFKEEERVKITKEKKPVNVKLIVIILAIVLLIVGLVLFFILRPTIEVRDFVGTNVSEVKAWIKQNDIESQGVIFREEYSFDYDESYITYQSISPEKKIRKNTKMDFTISLGADPEEPIAVPDIETMYKDELQAWIKDNKLSKTKIMTAYSDEKEVDEVISYEFKGGADVDNFKRSSQLTITVSKGPQPAGTVTVNDFVKQNYAVVETWGKTNKIEIVKNEAYSDTIEKDLVISQSVEAKKTMKEGETLTVVVSLGKAVYAKNFVGTDTSELDHWASKNGIYLIKKEIYNSYPEGYVISQSIPEGKIVKDEMSVEVSLGNPKLPKALQSMSYDELKQWVNEVNEKGANINRKSKKETNSDDIPVRGVIDINGYTNITEIECGATIQANVSKGKNIWLELSYTDNTGTYTWEDAKNAEEDYARKICELSGINYTVVYEKSSDITEHYVISIKRPDGNDIAGGAYISESEQVVVKISIGQ